MTRGPASSPMMHAGKYWVNKKPRASNKHSYSLAAQRRLWDILVQQTGADVLPEGAPQAEGVGADASVA